MSDLASPAPIYLDCPYSEKDEAKAAGAQWDTTAKRWFIPRSLYPEIYRFNQWLSSGKIYLNCPFAEKDDAKKAGAKWDSAVKCWFVTVNKAATVPAKFNKWLVVDSLTVSGDDTKEKSPKKQKRGHSLDATRLRINEAMTVSQLQTECRFRGIRGFSGKNKDWMLQQLTVGSIWQSFDASPSSSMKEPNKGETKKSPEKAQNVPVNKTKNEEKTSTKLARNFKEKAQKSPVNKAKNEVKASSKPAAKAKGAVNKVKNEEKATSKPDTKAKKTATVKSVSVTKAASMPTDLTSFPRVSSALTVVQLKHEYMHRRSNINTGLSNKSKSWFLDQLGEESIWTTSPEISGSTALAAAPRVSKSLTVAQLVHELLTRNPSTKGLSNKSKDELLKRAGEGSIWTTADLSPKDPAKRKCN